MSNKQNGAIVANHNLEIVRALNFAAQRYVQKSELTKSDYINHITEVAWILAEATDGSDRDLVVACLLHETIASHNVSYDEVAALFGSDVAALVREAGIGMSRELVAPRYLLLQGISNNSPRVKMLRIADVTSSLHLVFSGLTRHWSDLELREYFAWAKQVVKGCRGINTRLDALFDNTCHRYSDVAGADLQAH